MGGQTSSTLQQMQGMFPQAGGGYQQAAIAPISAPQYQPALMPSPEQAAAATAARIQARTPMAAPKGVPMRGPQFVDPAIAANQSLSGRFNGR